MTQASVPGCGCNQQKLIAVTLAALTTYLFVPLEMNTWWGKVLEAQPGGLLGAEVQVSAVPWPQWIRWDAPARLQDPELPLNTIHFGKGVNRIDLAHESSCALTCQKCFLYSFHKFSAKYRSVSQLCYTICVPSPSVGQHCTFSTALSCTTALPLDPPPTHP